MFTVRHLLQAKGHEIWYVSLHTSVFEGIQLMAEKDVGSLLILKDGKLKGIFSERDYARKIVLQGKTSRATAMRDVMTRDVICVDINQTVDDCMAIMTEKHIRHLPVLEKDQLIGVVSIGDVVKLIISDQEFVIDQMVNYIRWEESSPPLLSRTAEEG
jgi:CBS domain-containing protein